MFVDTSAWVEALLSGPNADSIFGRLETAKRVMLSPLVAYEVVSVVSSRLKAPVNYAEDRLHDFLAPMPVEVMSITVEIGALAVAAMARYGKGRGNPAQLNFGDCFSYACAKSAGVPLLYVGADFSHTDLA